MIAVSDQLPFRWAAAPVGEVFRIVGGGTPATDVSEYWDGTIPWITSADIDDQHKIQPRRSVTDRGIQESATNRVPQGSVIVVTRVGLGKVGIAPTELCFSQDSQALLFDHELIEPRYVVFYMGQVVSIFKHIGRGTTISGVTKKQLSELEFLLPPRKEQGRIVAEIEKQFTRLDDAVAALKRVQANLKRYRASILKAACEGRLVPTEAELARKEGRGYEPASELLKRILAERRAKWEAAHLQKMIGAGKPPKDDHRKENYKEPIAPDESNMFELPVGWVWASLDQLFRVERGRFSVRPRNDPRYFNGSYPFVQIGNLPREGGQITTYEQTLNLDGLRVSKLFRKGTVLIAIVGATIANTGVLVFDSCCPDSLVGLQAEDRGLLRFAEAYLRSRKLLLRQSSYSSGGQPNINLAMLLPYPIPLPPVAEQMRIVAELERRLTTIDDVESVLQGRMRTANRLRGSLLKRAFEGKLVPQDPNDEPASVLLERIRVERAAASASKNGNPKATTEPVHAHTQRRRRVAKLADPVRGGKT